MNFMRKIVQATILIMVWILCNTCYAADILFVDRLSERPTVAEQQMEIASRFYGLDFDIIRVDGTDKNLKNVVKYISQNQFLAVVISGNALNDMNSKEILTAIWKKSKPVPIMITGVTSQSGSSFLNEWTGGTVECCKDIKELVTDGFYRFSGPRDLTQELNGQDIAFINSKDVMGQGLIIGQDESVEPIMTIINERKEKLAPVFVKTKHNKQELYIQADLHAPQLNEKSELHKISDKFIEIAPMLIFLRHSFNQRAWHSPGHYANLIIDDPWLTEPYGHLNFKRLFNEMHKSRFHMTIGFIPWNFDRSKPEVVELFRDHPDKFSLSIHGNNHDHREFNRYEKAFGDPWEAKPLSIHEANIKQALGRMEELNKLTGLAYDRIMVFPHGIAPEKTLGLLKKYNFLATVNTGNIPLGSSKPKDPLFYLRPFSLTFENFVSVNRYSAKMSKADIAVHLFLGNPIIFYGHHDLFVKGIDAFNRVSDFVNSIDPHVEWCSLGTISRHLYLQRIRNDGNYDILSFSRNIEIRNTHMRDITYFVKKEESFSIPIKRIVVNGKDHPYQKDGNYLSIEVPIISGESKVIEIEYQNEFNFSSVDISKKNLYISLLRNLSDFRDTTVSNNPLGRIFIYYYYNTALYKIGLLISP